jgi:hypothetical protein
VMVPRLEAGLQRWEDLHVAHSGLDEPPCHEAACAVGGGLGPVEAVELAGGGGFAGEIEQTRGLEQEIAFWSVSEARGIVEVPE